MHDCAGGSSRDSVLAPRAVSHVKWTNGEHHHAVALSTGHNGQHGNGHDTHLELAEITRRQLELLGEDPEREGLQRTPLRVAKALAWLTKGYGESPAQVVGNAIFEEERSSMVMVRDIEMYSLCEHHLLPFFGRVHIAYVPDGKIIGLSKLPRIVDVFARRLQVQERLTEEIADAVEDVLLPLGVRVSIEAVHLCMMMRGVQKQQSATITGAARGVFKTDHGLEAEFQQHIRSRTHFG